MKTAVQTMSSEELIRITHPDPSGFGGLRCEQGLLPMEAMRVRASITGLSASVQVSQTFRNSLSDALEVTYIFPLPPRAAVTSFRMEVDGRMIEGLIKERGQARRDYDQAIQTGHRAAITEEDRSGVFTMRAGNIMPGETAIVHLELAGPLAIEDGDPCFRFPLVVAPRYMPGSALDGASVGDGTAVDTDAVPDASRISPPVLLKGCKSPVQLSLEVDINSGGLPISQLRSSLHSVITEERAGRTCLRLEPGERLDRDFILRFGLGTEEVGTQLSICPDTTKREDGNDGTIALTLIPPKASTPNRPRDIVFVLDRSGSMGGWKMVAARRAVGRMLDTLGDGDRYNVFAFDNQIERPKNALGNALIEASDRNRYRTLEWLSTVDAQGGTQMLEPISSALSELAGGYQSRDRMMVLITDGQVGNEDQILRSIKDEIRNVRVFTIGIDQSVNEGFLRRLAVMGGGSCALVESEDRLDEVMDNIHRRIATPVVTEIQLKGHGIAIDQDSLVPSRLPDLFEGSPVVIRARYKGEAKGAIELEGSDSVGNLYQQEIVVAQTEDTSLHSIWARGRVRDLEDRYAIGRGDLGTLEKRILAISLNFAVLSRFTAFVAVDKEKVVNPGGGGSAIVQPVEAPAGWGESDAELVEDEDFFDLSGAVGGAIPIPMSMPSAPSPVLAPRPSSVSRSAPSPSAPSPSAPMSRPASRAPVPQGAGGVMRGKPSPKKRKLSMPAATRGFFGRKKESAPVEERALEPVVTIVAYQQRLSELLKRSASATDARARMRILLQGLLLILDDLKSVQAPANFVSELNEAVKTLRVLWSDSQTEDLGEVSLKLESLAQVQPPAIESKPEPERPGFWK